MENKDSEDPYIEITWYLSDITEYRPELTREQALEVLSFMERKHDCEIGINWEAIDIMSDIVIKSKG